MKLRVQYTAQLRTVVGHAEEVVELPPGTRLAELLAHLAAIHPDAGPHLVTSTGQIRPSLLVALNETAVPRHAASTILLHEGDVVTLLPPIAGG